MSRGTESNPFGKNDCEIKTRVDATTDERFTALATIAGHNKGEHLRRVIMDYVHGHYSMVQSAASDGRPRIGTD